MSAINIKNLTLTYDRQPVVEKVSGGFAANSLTAIVGPNGAGKSTLLKTIAGMHTPINGTYTYNGFSKKDVAYLPQLSSVDRSFPIHVFDAVLLGHWQRIGPFKRISPKMCEEAHHALESVGLEGFECRPISDLSAGQFQRVLFARINLQNAPVVLLDEPFTGMDIKTVHDLMKVIQRWHQEKKTVIAVLHDMDQVRDFFPYTLLLARECIAWGNTEDVLTPENLTKSWEVASKWGDPSQHHGWV